VKVLKMKEIIKNSNLILILFNLNEICFVLREKIETYIWDIYYN